MQVGFGLFKTSLIGESFDSELVGEFPQEIKEISSINGDIYLTQENGVWVYCSQTKIMKFFQLEFQQIKITSQGLATLIQGIIKFFVYFELDENLHESKVINIEDQFNDI